MSPGNERAPKPSTDPSTESAPVECSKAPTSTMSSIAADRLYQFAAVTAGLFLLATLL